MPYLVSLGDTMCASKVTSPSTTLTGSVFSSHGCSFQGQGYKLCPFDRAGKPGHKVKVTCPPTEESSRCVHWLFGTSNRFLLPSDK